MKCIDCTEDNIMWNWIGYQYKCHHWRSIKSYPCFTLKIKDWIIMGSYTNTSKCYDHYGIVCWMWCFCSGSLFLFSWSREGHSTSKIWKKQTIKCLRELSTIEELQNALARDNSINLRCMVPAVPFLTI